jgi:hypothetical protein
MTTAKDAIDGGVIPCKTIPRAEALIFSAACW